MRRGESSSREKVIRVNRERGCFSKLPINRDEITEIGIISVFDHSGDSSSPIFRDAVSCSWPWERERERRWVTSLITSVTSSVKRLKGWLVTLDSWPREPWTEANWFVSTIYISLLFPPIALIGRDPRIQPFRSSDGELWLMATRIILAPSSRATLLLANRKIRKLTCKCLARFFKTRGNHAARRRRRRRSNVRQTGNEMEKGLFVRKE